MGFAADLVGSRGCFSEATLFDK
ncbi:hypothetical protein BOS5A_190013 [Bosea sp. EC-HK365B]|nr:hypothetical protein BOSE7B_100065 [Bosea sp. 7B]CAD5289201.1 hypothetical protein BOSE21B_50635 [Bosea sp. 21B]VVT57305.1 hypothetical protein BOS5A_190013 [Bosea sp. EC-HK365B]VXB52071.1 hypothetical protein BOSE127_120255 [Bosea sp. 127]CAD5290810.1 hypothetical protein BOSE21B_70001 [Bosea sp. 21B]